MPLQPLPAWKAGLAALPPSGPPWSDKFANFYAIQIATISPDPSVFVPSGFLFTFNVAIFKMMLMKTTPTLDPKKGTQGFADAWEAAIMASTVVTAPGSFLVPSSPPTLFSVVASSVIDPPSIAKGKLLLQTLMAAPPAAGGDKSKFPQVFRDATLCLTMTVIGVNSVTPTPGPLTAPNIPFI